VVRRTRGFGACDLTGTVEAMRRFAALLRGIAPSGTNMTNDKLRAVFEGLGLDDVASVLASGNIVFRSDATDAPALEQRIEDALAMELGISSAVFLRTSSELRALVDSDPFPGVTHTSGTYLTATFVKDSGRVPTPLPGQLDPGTRIVRYDRAARAVLAVTDNSEPNRARGYMVWLDQSFGKGITTRSWLTVQRIVRRLEG
jgi:uncharacterized protein (DUF1697 family)